MTETRRVDSKDLHAFVYAQSGYQLWVHDSGLQELVDSKGQQIYLRTPDDLQAVKSLMESALALSNG